MTLIYGTLVFNQNIREGNEALPTVLRTTARHEMGHGQGLDNGYNCPPGSTVMNPSPNSETYVTPCDVEAINRVSTYPSTPTQHPLASQSNIAVPPPQNVVPVSVENGIMSAWSVLRIRKTMDV